jgi:hypothetical protein
LKTCISLRPQLKGQEVMQWLILVRSEGFGAAPKLRCLLTVLQPEWPWFMWDLWWISGNGAGFLRVLRFPLPILINHPIIDTT